MTRRGCSTPGGKLVGIRIGWGKAEDIRIAEGLGAQARAHRVANDAANSRVGAAVRFNGTGVIVRFDFEDHVIVIVELDDARVIRENLDAPIVLAPSCCANGLRGLEDGFLEHVLKLS